MRLLKEIPEIESKIRSGALTLSVISQAQSFFKRQEKKGKPYSREEKVSLLTEIEENSTRDCERRLLQLDPDNIRTDHERRMSDELVELRMTVTHEFMAKIESLKNILSHAMPSAATKEIIEFALDELLASRDPLRDCNAAVPSAPEVIKRSRGITKLVRREVWRRCEGQCCYVDPVSGRRCLAKRYLEIDHIQPRSKMGSNDPGNLQLLCSAHNKLKSDL